MVIGGERSAVLFSVAIVGLILLAWGHAIRRQGRGDGRFALGAALLVWSASMTVLCWGLP